MRRTTQADSFNSNWSLLQDAVHFKKDELNPLQGREKGMLK